VPEEEGGGHPEKEEAARRVAPRPTQKVYVPVLFALHCRPLFVRRRFTQRSRPAAYVARVVVSLLAAKAHCNGGGQKEQRWTHTVKRTECSA
jgi:hypothetical protein